MLNRVEVSVLNAIVPIAATFLACANIAAFKAHTKGRGIMHVMQCLGAVLIWTLYGALTYRTRLHAIDEQVFHEAAQTTQSLVSWSLLLERMAFGVTKGGIILGLRAVFLRKQFQTISAFFLMLLIIWTIVFSLTSIFECGSSFALDRARRPQNQNKCVNAEAVQIAYCVTNDLMTVCTIGISLCELPKIQLTRAVKILYCFAYLFAFLSLFTGITRTVLYIQMAFLKLRHSESHNPTFPLTGALSLVSLGFAIMSICVPPLGRFAGPHLKRLVSAVQYRLYDY